MRNKITVIGAGHVGETVAFNCARLELGDVVLLDIRTPAEYKSGHISGAILLDYYASDFVDRLKGLDRDKTYLIYCRSGNRSGKSLAIFEKLGFRHAYHLETGIRGWMQERFPLVQ